MPVVWPSLHSTPMAYCPTRLMALARTFSGTLDGPAAPEASEEITVHLVPLAEIESLFDRGGFLQALHTAPLMRLLLQRRRKTGG